MPNYSRTAVAHFKMQMLAVGVERRAWKWRGRGQDLAKINKQCQIRSEWSLVFSKQLASLPLGAWRKTTNKQRAKKKESKPLDHKKTSHLALYILKGE